MKPDGLLTEKNYTELVRSLQNEQDRSVFLLNCEREYLETNPRFYDWLIKAIDKAMYPHWNLLNNLLLANPGNPDLSEYNIPRLQALKQIKEIAQINRGKLDQVAKREAAEDHPAAVTLETITHLERALCYFYRSMTGSYSLLTKNETRAFREITDKHGGKPEAFRNQYQKVKNRVDRINGANNEARIRKILPLLKDYPEALQMAENELNEIMNPKSRK
ncbi:MAG: hypothetical protein DA408_14480 [Bacteroidetes bacterium]|nr:MAG: hypothetical protein DA408_14480 [Bacteroidota bacterium]